MGLKNPIGDPRISQLAQFNFGIVVAEQKIALRVTNQ